MTFLQGGTEVTTGTAELGAVGRAEGQCPVHDQDVCKEMSCPRTGTPSGHTGTPRRRCSCRDQWGTEQLDQPPEQTPVGGVTPQNPVGAVSRAGFWSRKEQAKLARCIVQVCSSFVLTTGTSGLTGQSLAKLSKYVVQIQAYVLLYCNSPVDWLIY